MDQEPSPATQAPLDEMCCPTCGARQAVAEICRRCKCDLSLVVAVQRRRQTLRRQCLRWLARQQGQAAIQAAEELHALAPDADSTRLLAVAHLASGDYAHALGMLMTACGASVAAARG
jgi:hypothetical protein